MEESVEMAEKCNVMEIGTQKSQKEWSPEEDTIGNCGNKTQRSTMRPQATFSFFILLTFSLLPPRPSFLPVPPSSSSLLPPRPSSFLVQHCLNHSEYVKVHFSSILTKALPTDGPTDRRTDQRTRPLIEMRTHLKSRLVQMFLHYEAG